MILADYTIDIMVASIMATVADHVILKNVVPLSAAIPILSPTVLITSTALRMMTVEMIVARLKVQNAT